jgi:hypothetical protein
VTCTVHTHLQAAQAAPSFTPCPLPPLAASLISLLSPPPDFAMPNLTEQQRYNLPRLQQLRQGTGTLSVRRCVHIVVRPAPSPANSHEQNCQAAQPHVAVGPFPPRPLPRHRAVGNFGGADMACGTGYLSDYFSNYFVGVPAAISRSCPGKCNFTCERKDRRAALQACRRSCSVAGSCAAPVCGFGASTRSALIPWVSQQLAGGLLFAIKTLPCCL